jgi:hypothetical protein
MAAALQKKLAPLQGDGFNLACTLNTNNRFFLH